MHIASLAAMGTFDLKERVEQLAGRQGCGNDGGRVDEVGLRDGRDGLGDVERACAEELGPRERSERGQR